MQDTIIRERSGEENQPEGGRGRFSVEGNDRDITGLQLIEAARLIIWIVNKFTI